MKISPRGWEKFQHYKDRSPAWIKLHKHLLDDFSFQRLPVASRALAPMLWLIASEYESGCISAEPEEIAFRLRITEQEYLEALKPLISAGFFSCEQDASNVLAHPERGDSLEKRREEIEKEEPTVLPEKPSAYRAPPCPTQEIVDLYHKHLPMLPTVLAVSDSRKRAISGRWREVCASEKFDREAGLEWFAWYFEHASKSRFLTGRSKEWKADFDFLVNPSKFAKVVEGAYHKEL